MGSKLPKNFAGYSKLGSASPSVEKSAIAAPQSEPLGARPLSAAQLSAATDRQRLLKQSLPLFESNLTQAEVAPLLGISPASLSRLLNLCPAKGNKFRKALAKCRRLIRLPIARFAPKATAGGRRSDFEVLVKVKSIVRHLEQRHAVHRAAGHSQAACIRAAIQDLGYFYATPPLAARRLRMGSLPKPLVQFLKRSFKTSARRPRRMGDFSKN